MENNKMLKRFIMTSTFAGAFLAAPLIGEAALGEQTLKQGTTHRDVKKLQTLLKNKGYFHYHETTTYFGPITKKAVMDFQRANRLVVDGIVGKQTYSKLLQKSFQEEKPVGNKPSVIKPATLEPVRSQASSKVLKLNSTGKQVYNLQEDLRLLGFFTFYKTTDFYGPITTEAVRKFQISQRLKPTGVADQTTLNRVQKQVAGMKKPSTSPSTTLPISKPSAEVTKDTFRLEFGSRGTEVMQLQTSLKKLGYFTYPMVTEYFGTVTEESVQKFQAANGLPKTGIVTTTVLNKIKEVENRRVETRKTGDQITISIVANASELIGVPYLWGGTTTNGFDCSGFIQYIFAKEGVQLPRTAAQLWDATTAVSMPAVGDLVFFETYMPGPSHLGIYIGNNQFVHSGTSSGVTISNLGYKYWQDRYLGSKRVSY